MAKANHTDQAATLRITAVPNVCEGKRTNNTLTCLLKEVRQWAIEVNQPDLAAAMQDAHGLMMTCWTEVDEGLGQLSQALRLRLEKLTGWDVMID